MKASVLIKELQSQIEAHGDIDVIISFDWMDYDVKSVDFYEKENHVCLS